MVKMPSTIYLGIVDDCLMRRERRFPIQFAINEFILAGYGPVKAKKWVYTMAQANGDHIEEPWINIKI